MCLVLFLLHSQAQERKARRVKARRDRATEAVSMRNLLAAAPVLETVDLW